MRGGSGFSSSKDFREFRSNPLISALLLGLYAFFLTGYGDFGSLSFYLIYLLSFCWLIKVCYVLLLTFTDSFSVPLIEFDGNI